MTYSQTSVTAMRYNVELSGQAEADVREIYRYIRKHGPASPDRWKAGLADKFASLEKLPESCGLAPENEHAEAIIRQKLYGPFRVLFIIRNSTVYVLTVRHGARGFLDPSELAEG